MNPVERFFRRYIFAAVGIVLFFLAVNLALLGAYYVLVIRLGGALESRFPIQRFSDHLASRAGTITADAQARDMLRSANAWAMVLRDDGVVLWEDGLPDELPRAYSVADVALFSRWYLRDYPVLIWERADGLLVVGLPPQSLVKHYFTLPASYVWRSLVWFAAAFLINLFVLIFLFVRNIRRVETAMTPILSGIQALSQGRPFQLDEKGDLAEISAGLNRAGGYLLQKDDTRAAWIRGISHDVRTPLSVILGYACEMEDDPRLPDAARRQAGVIREKSEQLRALIADLNLTTKLEYALYPVRPRRIDAVELARQAASEYLNDLPARFSLEVQEARPGERIELEGDAALLYRMLRNLIQNSIAHNPQGCSITICVGREGDMCAFDVSDDGRGVDAALLKSLNLDEATPCARQEGGAEHGLGLKIVRQVVKAHRGEIAFAAVPPHGLRVKIVLPEKRVSRQM